MREIKFRCWDKFQRKYIFIGYHVIGEITVFGGIEIVIRDTWTKRSKALGYKTTIESWNDFIEEQFTGLLDKSGKEIYEGDIIRGGIGYSSWQFYKNLPKFPTGHDGYSSIVAIFEIIYNIEDAQWDKIILSVNKETSAHYDEYNLKNYFVNKQLKLKRDFYGINDDYPEMEIIGNIHENPELLKGGKNK